jgi:uncharacterized protein
VEFIFHGGEPLLASKRFFRSFVAEANRRLLSHVTPAFNMQTNGTLLDREWLDPPVRPEHRLRDQPRRPKEIDDANRVDHGGHGSYDRVRRAIDLVLSDSHTECLFGGLLTVINLDVDPAQLYRVYTLWTALARKASAHLAQEPRWRRRPSPVAPRNRSGRRRRAPRLPIGPRV